MNRTALLLAGGAGTRLWPLSSDENPKQFLRLFGGESLLRKTWNRVAAMIPAEAIYVSTNERYRQKCLHELPDLLPGNIIAEPDRRNTAPAIAFSCFEIESRQGSEAAIACLPADHFIEDEPEFLRVLDRAYAYAESTPSLVTIGLTPTEPNTGYGYLELGEEVAPGVVALRQFKEKPTRERAAEFLSAGNYAWNGGIFVWRASVFRSELERAAPEVARVTRERYADAPSISIDYALMEKAQHVVTVPGDFGWSDVGTWAAVAKLAGRGNAELHTRDAAGVFAQSESGRRVVAIGVKNVAIVESPEGILVLDLAQPELLSEVVKILTK
jgi:mannose-1-phosphate guanylyltransferase